MNFKSCRMSKSAIFTSALVTCSMLAGLFLILEPDAAAAQQPTPDERNAIRASCRSDFIAHCSSVPPGGKEALECLQRNLASVSAACRTAVMAIEPRGAPKAAVTAEPPASKPTVPSGPAASRPEPPQTETQAAPAASEKEQLGAVQKACTVNDFVSHCPQIAPANPEILRCLRADAAELSPSCRTAVRDLPSAAAEAPLPTTAHRPPAPTRKSPDLTRATSASPAEAPAAAGPKQPSPEELSAIRSNCRSDFMSHCSGVQPGGVEALQCLKRNSAQLSAACQGAVAAISERERAATPAAGAAAPVVAPLTPMPFIRLRQALGILRVCGADQHALCPGIPPGGGRLINCLAENASRLSPECYGAMAAARR